MAPLPYTDPAARIPFYALLGVFVVLEMRIRLRSMLNRVGSRSDRSSRLLVYASVTAGLVGAFALAGGLHAAEIPDGRWALFAVGLVLMGAGIAIRQWSVALLGRLFTTDVRVHPGQTVVDTGPYRWVRHPSYTGMLMTLVGIGLALGNWAALAILLVVPTAGLVYRIGVEERALLDGLGEPYRRFAASRSRLIPGVW
ncbi:MAG TPA: isoprenylcysteine carboxylmethyltransferase family protein [Solirubrobacteraceae bacterium]|nr:isoprenylcysteine carboxylmethyltransferase family protein [Solirubrobacteraceae bacterium]